MCPLCRRSSGDHNALGGVLVFVLCPYFRESHHANVIFLPVFRVFLLRDSQSNPKTFVLSLCHMQRIKHFQILPVSFPPVLHTFGLDCLSWRSLSPCLQMDDEGEVLFSLDDGHTRFTDLIQLVEFYQLNCGVLPCKLKHHCTRIALWARSHRRSQSGQALPVHLCLKQHK